MYSNATLYNSLMVTYNPTFRNVTHMVCSTMASVIGGNIGGLVRCDDDVDVDVAAGVDLFVPFVVPRWDDDDALVFVDPAATAAGGGVADGGWGRTPCTRASRARMGSYARNDDDVVVVIIIPSTTHDVDSDDILARISNSNPSSS
jgi:hypothetical protein